MVEGHPRQPLRLVVKLCGHVERNGQVRLLLQRLLQEQALLPPRLPVAVALEALLQVQPHRLVQLPRARNVVHDRHLSRPSKTKSRARKSHGIVPPQFLIRYDRPDVAKEQVPVHPAPVCVRLAVRPADCVCARRCAAGREQKVLEDLAVERLQIAQPLGARKLGLDAGSPGTQLAREALRQRLARHEFVPNVTIARRDARRRPRVHDDELIVRVVDLIGCHEEGPPRWERADD
mmetsp:Transcript_10422/g.30805  ORF Transcript_10422/g.30805 Transcript_10422/m.30805 type:complete len:234 (-) Transcript_10422:43-744(-)